MVQATPEHCLLLLIRHFQALAACPFMPQKRMNSMKNYRDSPKPVKACASMAAKILTSMNTLLKSAVAFAADSISSSPS